ncbi:EFR1 family ferrodoxin [Candidatus Woesearchaeota archaeon]|nr:EFR1 family ferrodoxin [Candidatus Woesearchaeota archaeon]
MRTTIFWFSGTGNSLKVAKDLAEKLDGDVTLVPIATAIRKQPDLTADRIGLVFPTYAWGPPYIVAQFLSKVKTSKYVFAVATAGASSAGCMEYVKKGLAAVGTGLDAGWVVLMPSNYLPFGGPPAEGKRKELYAAEQARIAEIAAAIGQKRSGVLEKGNLVVNAILTGFVYQKGIARFREADREFWVNDRCISCGRCALICPVGNIRMANGHPTWLHRCEQCLACIHWCPSEAIQLGTKSEGKQRYHHPDIAVEELFLRT